MALSFKVPAYKNCEQDSKMGCQSNDDKMIRMYTYEWTILNYSLIRNFPQEIKCPEFIVGQNGAEVMTLCLSPGSDSNSKIEISLRRRDVLEMPKPSTHYKKTEVNLEFLDSNGKILDYYIGLPCEFKYIKKFKSCIWKKEENVSRFIENDLLKIRAKLSLWYSSISEKDKPSYSKSIEKLANDMKKLVGGRFFPDLTIRVGGHRFSAHKSVVLPQLPYAVKLNSELKPDQLGFSPVESSSSRSPDSLNKGYDSICIPNENAEVFLSILHYLYCGKLFSSNTVNDFDLFEFAQRYKLYELSMSLKPDEMYSRSQTKPLKMSFYWYVKEFSVRSLDRFNLLQSPIHKIGVGTEDISWSASLFFYDYESISLSLQRIAGFDKDVQAAFKLTVCHPDGTPQEEREFKHFFSGQLPSCYPGFLDHESRFKIAPSLLFDDTLTIRCELIVSDGQITSEVSRIHSGEVSKLEFNSWHKNLRNLWETGDFSDILLSVEDVEFKVHKAILSSRSPVFARMFDTDMYEKFTWRVKIAEISSTVMECVLKYIYTGKLNILNMDDTPEIYSAADKYEIFDLKDSCAEFIMANLDTDSAPKILILSDLHNDVKMKEAAKNIICENARQSLLTANGQKLMENYPNLAGDILDSLSTVFCSRPPQDTYENMK